MTRSDDRASATPGETHPASWTATPAKANPVLRAAWASYYKALDEMRAYIENTSMFENPQDRAKAYHSLMEMQALAYNYVIAPRMTNPRILVNTSLQRDVFTLGLNGPDCLYGDLFLDGTQTYRMRGRIGEISFFSIYVQNKIWGDEGAKPLGNFNLSDMTVAKDGTFEIVIGGPKRTGNWIPLDLTSKYNMLIIRRTLPDWGNSDKGDLTVERITSIEPGHYDRDEFDEVAMAARIRRAEAFIRYIPEKWIVGLYDAFIGPKGEVNTVRLLPGTVTDPAAEATSNYVMGVFSLKDDEALILELDKVPDGAYWGFQLGDVWDRALPYYDLQTSLNHTQVVFDADGGLRVVIAKKDPGVANWLDTAGRNKGEIVFRSYGSRVPSLPRVRKVKLSQVLSSLPPGTKLVSAGERQRALEHRRQAVLKLYGE